MKKVVISGATGTIGVALVKCLIYNDIEVLVLTHSNSKRISALPKSPNVKIAVCGMNEYASFDTSLFKNDYDVFYHFAWQGGKERNNFDVNLQSVRYTLDAVELAKRFGCKKFIGAGSQAEYGVQECELNGDVLPNPINAFGAAKLSAGVISRVRAQQFGMEHIWVRILSVYGPNDGSQTMVMSLINKLMDNIRPSLTKCEQIWDFLYCDDAARAMKLIGEKGKDGKIYVLGNGEAKQLLEYVKCIHQIVNPNVNLGIGEVEYANNQIMYLCADISELKNDLDFSPDVSFSEGILRTYEWVTQQRRN